jgi:alpha-L-fucosidase 2
MPRAAEPFQRIEWDFWYVCKEPMMRLHTAEAAVVSLAVALLAAPAALGAGKPKPVVRRNVVYSPAGKRGLKLDASIPPGAGPFPAAVVVHGGAWILKGRRFGVKPLLKPLSEAGFAWFAISYRTAVGKGSIEDGIADVTSAVAFVREHAAEYKVDPEKVVLIGESSGGHLAALAALRNFVPVRAVVGISSPMDLPSLFWMAKALPPPFRQLKTAELMLLSPATFARPVAPPFLLIHGTADLLVPFGQSEKMCERMQAMGGVCEVVPVKAAPHGMRLWIGHSEYKRRMTEWLRAQVQ